MENKELKRLVSILIALPVVTAAAMLTGCDSHDQSPSPESIVSLDAINLKEYDWAMSISPISDLGGDQESYLGLVKHNGDLDILPLKTMDVGIVRWEEDGLVFVDSESDYAVSNDSTVSVFESNKPLVTEGAVRLLDGDSLVSVYNGGFLDEGQYNELVYLRNGKELERIRAQTAVNYQLVAACENDVYGINADFKGDYDFEIFLDQLVEDSQLKFKRIITLPTPLSDSTAISTDGACVDGQIISIAVHTLPAGFEDYPTPFELDPEILKLARIDPLDSETLSVMMLTKWDTSTGEISYLPLREPSGELLNISKVDVMYAYQQAGGLTADNALIWISGTGIVFETQLESGVTTVLTDQVNKATGDASEHSFSGSFADESLSVLVQGSAGAGSSPRIFVIDKSSGARLKEVSLDFTHPGLKDTKINSLAQRPDLVVGD